MALFRKKYPSNPDALRAKFEVLENDLRIFPYNPSPKVSQLFDMLPAIAGVDIDLALKGAQQIMRFMHLVGDDRRGEAWVNVNHVVTDAKERAPVAAMRFMAWQLAVYQNTQQLASKQSIAANMYNFAGMIAADHPVAALEGLGACLRHLPDDSLQTPAIRARFRQIENDLARSGDVERLRPEIAPIVRELLDQSTFRSVEENLATVAVWHPLVALAYLGKLIEDAFESEHPIMGPRQVAAHMLALIEQVRGSDPLRAFEAMQDLVLAMPARVEGEAGRLALWKELALAASERDPEAVHEKVTALLMASPFGSTARRMGAMDALIGLMNMQRAAVAGGAPVDAPVDVGPGDANSAYVKPTGESGDVLCRPPRRPKFGSDRRTP